MAWYDRIASSAQDALNNGLDSGIDGIFGGGDGVTPSTKQNQFTERPAPQNEQMFTASNYQPSRMIAGLPQMYVLGGAGVALVALFLIVRGRK